MSGYDDEGRGVRVAGATVRLGAATQLTDAAGVARFTLPAGQLSRCRPSKPGLVRSYPQRVAVP